MAQSGSAKGTGASDCHTLGWGAAPAHELPGGKAGGGNVQARTQQLALAQPLLGVLQGIAQALEGRSYAVGKCRPKALVRLLASLYHALRHHDHS